MNQETQYVKVPKTGNGKNGNGNGNVTKQVLITIVSLIAIVSGALAGNSSMEKKADKAEERANKYTDLRLVAFDEKIKANNKMLEQLTKHFNLKDDYLIGQFFWRFDVTSIISGKELSQKILSELKTEVLPEVNEDFLKPLQVKDEAELKERITETITKQKEDQNEEAMCEELLDTIAKDLEIPIPEDLLKRQSGNLLQQSEAVYKIMSVPEEDREKFGL